MRTLSKLFPKLFLYALPVVGALFFAASSQAEIIDSSYVGDIHMVEGELEQVKVYSLTRLSITDPEVADVVDADDNEILLVASEAGETILFIWDEKGKRSINIHVSKRDLVEVRDRLKKLFRDVSLHETIVKINTNEGKVVIGGEIPEHKQDLFEQIIEPFDEQIIALAIAEENENMVQIDMQITELSETLTKNLGVDWSSGGEDEDSGGTTDTSTTAGSTDDEGGSGLTLGYDETLPDFDGSIGDLFKIGDFERTTALTATVNALIAEGKARVLSQPRLVVKNGEEASFLVGGEIPIRTTTTSSSGGSQENVEFKEYGIGMTLTPVLRKEKIEVVMNIEISDVDQSTLDGGEVAFVTRSANTTLLLDDGQTIVLAGLIRQSEAEAVRKTPFLGDMPILGLLFRSRTSPKQDSEVVISLTPHIMYTGVKSVFVEEEEEIMPLAEGLRPMMRRMPPSRALGLPTEMRSYIQKVQEQISKAVVYPQEAERYGWEGTVKVGLHILSDGTLAYALVKESSGFDIIDDFALKTTQDVAPFENFPPDTNLQEVNVTIPIMYSLKR